LGYAFWGERLTLLQGVGAGLILMAVFGQMLFEVRTAERDIALNE
jgi:drug/metabolite transporter (DMT)-like permease